MLVRNGEVGQVGPTDYIIERYHGCRQWRLFPKEFMCLRDHDFVQKEVLEFGCGEGQISTQLALLGTRVKAVDISPELIGLAERPGRAGRRSQPHGIRRRDIMESPLPEGWFDFLVSHAALHHVSIRAVLPRLLTFLKPGGMAIVVEPITFFSLFQHVRDMLPIEKDAPPEERQLNDEDVKLIRESLIDCRITFLNIFGRLARFLGTQTRLDEGSSRRAKRLGAAVADDLPVPVEIRRNDRHRGPQGAVGLTRRPNSHPRRRLNRLLRDVVKQTVFDVEDMAVVMGTLNKCGFFG